MTTTEEGLYPPLPGEVGVVYADYPCGDGRRYGLADLVNKQEVARTALSNAITSVLATGWNRLEIPAGEYQLGELTEGKSVFNICDKSDVTITSAGARMVCTTKDNTLPRIFYIQNSQRIRIEGVRLYDQGTDLMVEWKGPWLFYLTTNTTAQPYNGFTFCDCGTEKAVGFMAVTGTSGSRIRNIRVDRCFAQETYYGINFQNNGDGVTAPDFYCFNVRRAYFPYGVTNHVVNLRIEGDSKLIGANACIPITRRATSDSRDTRNIKVRASFGGTVQEMYFTNGALKSRGWGSLVKLVHQEGAKNNLIDDIDIELNIDSDAKIGGGCYPIRITDDDKDGKPKPTTEARWDRIRVGGNFFNKALVLWDIPTTQNAEGFLAIDPAVFNSSSYAAAHYPGFCVRPAHDREVRTSKGAQSTKDGQYTQSVTIPMIGLESNAFVLVVRTYAHDGGLAAGNGAYREHVIDGYNAGGGAISFTNPPKLLAEVVRGAAPPTVAFLASGENIQVQFVWPVKPSNPSTCFARVEVQYVSRGPIYPCAPILLQKVTEVPDQPSDPPTVTISLETPTPSLDLSVLGGSERGESALTYSWSWQGPYAVIFAPNGTNGAKRTRATFALVGGDYCLTAEIKDDLGRTTTSSLKVTVISDLPP